MRNGSKKRSGVFMEALQSVMSVRADARALRNAFSTVIFSVVRHFGLLIFDSTDL